MTGGRLFSRRGVRSDRGSITAEFVVLLPVVVVLMVACLGAIRGVTLQMQLSDAASVVVRVVARGESFQQATAVGSTIVPDAHFVSRSSPAGSAGGPIVCVTASVSKAFGWLPSIGLAASSCALAVSSAFAVNTLTSAQGGGG